MNNEFDDVISESSHISISSDGSTPVSLRYMYCASSDAVDNAERHFRSVLSNAQGGIIQVFLDCEGRDLGRHGGKLGLVQLGIEEEAYVIDVIEFPGSLMHLKGILEHPQVQKVVWDGRSDYSELWHGHRIRMRPVLDLQLVDVYRYSPERVNRRCSIRLSGLGKAFDKTRHIRHDTDFWVKRPLDQESLEYSAFDVFQLRALYSIYKETIDQCPHILQESQRYVEILHNSRRVKYSPYIDHGLLPQEILEPPYQWKSKFDRFGTRVCAGCQRRLHQYSFKALFNKWQAGTGDCRLCYTCFQVRPSR